MKKILTLALALVLLTACGEAKAEREGYYVGINQFAQHESLNNCRQGLMKGLKSQGIEEGKNLKVDYKNADADLSVANQIASSMAGGKLDVVVAIATPSAQASFNALLDSKTPMVYTAITDPVEAKLANPDRTSVGNATGTSDELPVGKQLETMREIMPKAKKLGILYTASESSSLSTIRVYEELSKDYGFELITMAVTSGSDIPMALDNMLSKVDVMTNILDNNVVNSLPLILDKANEKKVPVFGSEVEQVKLGCIAAEGIDYLELGKQTGIMVAKVLKGEIDPSNTKYESFDNSNLYINKRVFEDLKIELPQNLLDRATEVFE